MKRSIIIVLILLVITIQCAAQYRVNLVNCPGANLTRFTGINATGLIVGGFRLPDLPEHAMIYRNEVCEDLSSILGSGYSVAYGVNNKGDIVGTHGGLAFVIHNGIVSTFEFPDSAGTTATDINDYGLVVGWYSTNDGFIKAFQMDNSGNLVGITLDVPGELDVAATGVNNRGEIVGWWDSDQNLLGHGWRLKKRGPAVSFDIGGAATESTHASGINDSGDLVGIFVEPGASRSRGFAWLANQIVIIDSPTPATTTNPLAINDHDVIVGTIVDADGRHGFIATPTR